MASTIGFPKEKKAWINRKAEKARTEFVYKGYGEGHWAEIDQNLCLHFFFNSFMMGERAKKGKSVAINKKA